MSSSPAVPVIRPLRQGDQAAVIIIILVIVITLKSRIRMSSSRLDILIVLLTVKEQLPTVGLHAGLLPEAAHFLPLLATTL